MIGFITIVAAFIIIITGISEIIKNEKGHRLIKELTSQSDPILSYFPIYIEVTKLFIRVYRKKKSTESYEDVFKQCKHAIFSLWWIYEAPVDISTETNEIIQQYITDFTPTAQDLSGLYGRYDDFNIYRKQIRFLINNFNLLHIEDFYNKVCTIANAVSRLSAKRDIYLRVHRFLASCNRLYSLMFYLHYLNTDIVNHEDISLKHDKLLFENKEQKEYFNSICKKLLTSKDIAKAFESLEKIQEVKKRIDLSPSAIIEAGNEQLEVVKTLGQYLSDEEAIPHQAILPEDKQPCTELVKLFISGGFRLSKQEVLLFAQERKLFPNQLIQKINEDYYETLDDLLIEEEEERYTMSEEYCKRLGLQLPQN